MQYVIIFFVMIHAFFSVEVHENYEYGECAPEKEVCEYWLSVKEKLAMIDKQDLVYAHKGKLYRYDDENATVAVRHVCTILQNIFIILQSAFLKMK